MTTLRSMLVERREQYDTHFALASALQDRIFGGSDVSLGEITLSARHLLTMQSGLLVHLYNIVEATMTGATELVGSAVGASAPRTWSRNALKEWLREYAVVRVDGGEDARLDMVHGVSLLLLAESPPGPQKLKKPSGTWTDTLIATFARRLAVPFVLPEEMWRRIASQPRYGDDTPLCFLADRRNAIAHGRRSFEDGCKDLSLREIRELADTTLDYLELAADAFQSYVDRRLYLAVEP
jgi:hypothetical protein